MSIYLIDKIKPMNNGNFALVDASDVEMSNGDRLDKYLEDKIHESGSSSTEEVKELSDRLNNMADDLTSMDDKVDGMSDKVDSFEVLIDGKLSSKMPIAEAGKVLCVGDDGSIIAKEIEFTSGGSGGSSGPITWGDLIGIKG